MVSVWANLVVGSNGATTFNGNSRALSSHLDRKRFHEIRSKAELILIGGQTARIEPYSKTPVELVVITRSPENIGSAAQNPRHRTINQSPAQVIEELLQQGKKNILVEGGANFLRDLLSHRLLDGIYITMANGEGDGNFVEIDELTQDFEIESIDDSDGESFFTYRRISH
jgi:riboflavin biosynthesis pyrimidine reductase